jgi:hypothetical protein
MGSEHAQNSLPASLGKALFSEPLKASQYWAGEMALPSKTFVIKPDEPIQAPGTHIVEKKNQFHKLPSDLHVSHTSQ